MSDFREIELVATSRFKIDVSDWFQLFDAEWRQFLEGEEPTDVLREEFIRETASELGRDLEDYTTEPYDTDYEVNLP